jgi:hypothetical protein
MRVAASNRIIAVTGWRHVDVFRHSGAFRRRICSRGPEHCGAREPPAVGISYPMPRAQVSTRIRVDCGPWFTGGDDVRAQCQRRLCARRHVLTARSNGSTAEPVRSLPDGRTGVLDGTEKPSRTSGDGFAGGSRRLAGRRWVGRVRSTATPAASCRPTCLETPGGRRRHGRRRRVTVEPNGDQYSAVRGPTPTTVG